MKREIKKNKTMHFLNPENWVQDYREYLVNYARKRVSDLGTAEDLVQDTFLSVWSARDRFRGHCSEKTWLVGILKNKIIDNYRRNSRRPLISESDMEVYNRDDADQREAWLEQNAIAGDRYDPSKNTEQFEFMEQLDQGIDRLPDLSGKAFRMREIQGLSTEEITTSLNITKSNLWVLIHRAKTGLQQHFNDGMYQENIRTAA